MVMYDGLRKLEEKLVVTEEPLEKRTVSSVPTTLPLS
jgi:hypothetical protein